MGWRGAWGFWAAVPGGAGDADRLGAGGRQVEGVEVGFGHGPVEADGLVGHRQRQGDGVVGLDEAGLAGRSGDAGLAAAVDGVDGGGLTVAAEPTAIPRSMSRRLQTGPVNSRSADWPRKVPVWWRNSAQVAYPQAPQS
jgi:hypothetical protein